MNQSINPHTRRPSRRIHKSPLSQQTRPLRQSPSNLLQIATSTIRRRQTNIPSTTTAHTTHAAQATLRVRVTAWQACARCASGRTETGSVGGGEAETVAPGTAVGEVAAGSSFADRGGASAVYAGAG